jgi:hypothetical protein
MPHEQHPLRELARAKMCHLRLIGCTYDASQSVLAHVRRGGVGGTGLKPPDVCGFPACKSCHDIFDGRKTDHGYARTEIDAEALRAQNQWLEWLWKNEYLIAVA